MMPQISTEMSAGKDADALQAFTENEKSPTEVFTPARFELFPSLPAEIRERIFFLALPSLREIKCWKTNSPFQPSVPFLRIVQSKTEKREFDTLVRSISRVCYHSRQVVLKHYSEVIPRSIITQLGTTKRLRFSKEEIRSAGLSSVPLRCLLICSR